MDYIPRRGSEVKTLLVFTLFCIFCISCLHMPPAYVQKGLVITPPITQAVDRNGDIVERAFNDGGTKMVRVTDASGKTFDVYIDHRIGKENEWGTVYVNGDPGTSN